MSQILVWKSDADGKLFEDKTKYTAHLRKLARHRNAQRKLQIVKETKDALWAELYEREQSLEQWAQMVIDNQHLFWAEAAEGDWHDWSRVGKAKHKGVVMPCPRLIEFTTFNMRWNDMVSNSHSCPVGGITCWSSHEAKDGRPQGYPGWQGRVDWIVEWPKEWDGHYLGSDLFSNGTFRSGRQRAHTGTGGGGGMKWNEKHQCHTMSHGYDFRIYAADWPGMARHYEKQKMWKELGGKTSKELMYAMD